MHAVTIVISLTTFLLFHSGCAGRKPETMATRYRFTYQNEEYRILSIFSDDEKVAANKLLGKDFVAIDFNKDRFIDSIVLGDVSLMDAQAIYEEGLKTAARENKVLSKVDDTGGFLIEETGTFYEIKSFHPPETAVFNEFHITNITKSGKKELSVLVDRGADGTLDEVLTGTISLEKAQKQYVQVITAGLKKRKLIRNDEMFLVKR
jgi:hypothetical protein